MIKNRLSLLIDKSGISLNKLSKETKTHRDILRKYKNDEVIRFDKNVLERLFIFFKEPIITFE